MVGVVKDRGELKRVPIEQIRREPDLQARASFDEGIAKHYAAEMEAGAVFPLIDVYFDGETYWLADGNYRVAAAELIGRPDIDAIVHRGDRRDAQLHAVGANSTHGVPRTHEDRRRAVRLLLTDAEWTKWSDQELGRRAHVSAGLVSLVRKERPEWQPAERTSSYTLNGRACKPRTRDVSNQAHAAARTMDKATESHKSLGAKIARIVTACGDEPISNDLISLWASEVGLSAPSSRRIFSIAFWSAMAVWESMNGKRDEQQEARER